MVGHRLESSVSSGSESGEEKVVMVNELASRIRRAKRHMVSVCMTIESNKIPGQDEDCLLTT